MSALRQKMLEDMQLKGLAVRTQEATGGLCKCSAATEQAFQKVTRQHQ